MESKFDKETESKARKMAIDNYKGEHGNHKPNKWICGNVRLSDSGETRCHYCGKICYYDTKLNIKVSKNVIKLCLRCAYEKFQDDFTALEKEIVKVLLDCEDEKNGKK